MESINLTRKSGGKNVVQQYSDEEYALVGLDPPKNLTLEEEYALVGLDPPKNLTLEEEYALVGLEMPKNLTIEEEYALVGLDPPKQLTLKEEYELVGLEMPKQLTLKEEYELVGLDTSTIQTNAKLEQEMMTDITQILTSNESVQTKTTILASKYGLPFISNWLVTNWKPLLWNVAYYTAITVTITVSYVYFAAGSWTTFLSILSKLSANASTTAAPGMLIDALKTAGVGILPMASVNSLLWLSKNNTTAKKVLETQVPTEYLNKVLKHIGVNLKNVKIEDVATVVATQGISVGSTLYTAATTGQFNLNEFIFMQAVSKAMPILKGSAHLSYNITTGTINGIGRATSILKDSVSNIVMSGKPNMHEDIIEEIVSISETMPMTREKQTKNLVEDWVPENLRTMKDVSRDDVVDFLTNEFIDSSKTLEEIKNTIDKYTETKKSILMDIRKKIYKKRQEVTREKQVKNLFEKWVPENLKKTKDVSREDIVDFLTNEFSDSSTTLEDIKKQFEESTEIKKNILTGVRNKIYKKRLELSEIEEKIEEKI